MKASLLTLEQIIQATGGLHVFGEDAVYFDNVQTDSRLVKKNSLFVPLIGEKQDGHLYVPQSLEKGASVVFIAKSSFEKDGKFYSELSVKYPASVFIAVDNTLTALQKSAARYVEKFPSLIKVAVTGSSGKTTTKELIASVLRQKYRVVSNRGNLNSETGLPLSVFEITDEHEAGVFEMGMNRENEIGEISAVLKARIAVITNIGTAHIGKLGSREKIAEEKAKVFDWFNGNGTAIIPSGDDYEDFLKSKAGKNIIEYGFDCSEDVSVCEDEALFGSTICIGKEKAFLSLPGKYNAKNALAAVMTGRLLGLTDAEIARGIESLEPLSGRSEVLRGKYTIIKDCYNANPDSLEKALDFISAAKVSAKKILVLGDMLELGEDSVCEHTKAGVLASKSGASFCVFAGNEMKAAYEGIRKTAPEFDCAYVPGNSDESMEKIVSLLKEKLSEKDVILVKGSRGMALERVIEKLENAS
ncbi:MAG: UDP-N-acetylmuramoyl-tripeptide--D-alanyl-D-alanine ligase [Treponema sp.]|nr:UDP-N-acetylmuramoyl-tripeptide--D-alanyl-D-alanine ligase [Treponema sp.]